MEQTITDIKSLRNSQSPSVARDSSRDCEHDIFAEAGERTLSIDPGSVAWFLGSIAFMLALASVSIQFIDYLTGYHSIIIHKLVKLFDLDLEVNVPTFFSVGILLIASLLLFVITLFEHSAKRRIFEWALLAGGFLFMAFDEMASIHERLIEPMRDLLGISHLGMFYYAWVVPAMVLVGVLGIVFLKFVIRLHRSVSKWFLLAGAMYLFGAVGLEMFEGVVGTGNFIYTALVTAEESFEMAGVIVFIWTLLSYIRDNSSGIQIRLPERVKGRIENVEPLQEFVF